MALHPNFPESPYTTLDPALRWFPADEVLRESSSEKLMPPLVPQLRRKVKEWRQPAQLVVQHPALTAPSVSPLALWERGRG